MTHEQIEQLIRERNSLRIELTRERIIAEYRFWHHTYFETYMRSVPAFAIDTEPGADHSAHWDHYLIFAESWKKNGPEHTFAEYLEVLNQRYDMMDQD